MKASAPHSAVSAAGVGGRAAAVKSPPSPLPVSKYTRWRYLTLFLVYVLMAIHVIHWKVAGKTLAPLELHEVMFTAELGIVTAGFLLMATVALATLVFGRFFCSWGCHIMGVQELASWVFAKLKIKVRPVRSRMLLWVPPLVLLYMFGWPQMTRMWAGRDFPPLRTQTDLEGISSFVTTDFWRNLPDPWITALTFFVCGFLVVYLLGNRAFCTYGCPYGVLFLTVDRLAPGRIRVDDNCAQCGTCTAVCTSGVRVHEEVARHGTIVNPRCLKDLDCVSACPEGALQYRWGGSVLTRFYSGKGILIALGIFAAALAVALFVPGAQSWWSGRFDLVPFGIAVALLGIVAYARSGMPARAYDFALWEELLMAVLFLATLVIYRQLYDAIPFLLTIGLGAAVAYAVVVAIRLFTRPTVRAIDHALKTNGRLRPAGRVYLVAVLAFLAFSVHSAMVQFHTRSGYRAFAAARAAEAAGETDAARSLDARALDHLLWSDRWGLFHPHRLQESLGSLYLDGGDPRRAEGYLRQVVAKEPSNAAARMKLGYGLILTGRPAEGEAELQEVLRVRSTTRSGQKALEEAHAKARYHLAEARAARGDVAGAKTTLEEAIRLRPDFAEAHYSLGALLLEEGNAGEAEQHLRQATELKPGLAAAHYNLGVALYAGARVDEAITEVRKAVELAPSDTQARALLDHLLRESASGAHAD